MSCCVLLVVVLVVVLRVVQKRSNIRQISEPPYNLDALERFLAFSSSQTGWLRFTCRWNRRETNFNPNEASNMIGLHSSSDQSTWWMFALDERMCLINKSRPKPFRYSRMPICEIKRTWSIASLSASQNSASIVVNNQFGGIMPNTKTLIKQNQSFIYLTFNSTYIAFTITQLDGGP